MIKIDFNSIWNGRCRKEAVRKLAMANNRPGNAPSKNVLMMPGDGLLDVKDGIVSGLINRDTRCLFAERDSDVARKIRVRLKRDKILKKLKKVILWDGPLSKIDRLPKGMGKFDHVFLDFNGSIMFDDAIWLIGFLSKHIANGADISFTVLQGSRRNTFVKKLIEFFRADQKRFEFVHSMAVKLGIAKQDRLAIIIATVHILLADFQFIIWDMAVYYDTASMFYFRLSNVVYNPDPNRKFLQIALLKFYRDFLSSPSSNTRRYAMSTKTAKVAKKRTESALKAWATRRRNGKKKKKKKIALKGESRKRHDAALKSWVTRRSNAA